MKESLTFQLGTFSGPLEFLIALVQNEELNIEHLSLKELTAQYLQILSQKNDLESGAEFVGHASFLIWLKSKWLLPQHEQSCQPEEEDPHFEIIHHLIDYCRFREAAKALTDREQKQADFYHRGMHALPEQKKPLGIEHLTLQDFASLFKQLVVKASSNTILDTHEEWIISDKIKSIQLLLLKNETLAFEELFKEELCKEELIVTFLAVLEMMKSSSISLFKVVKTGQIKIAAKEQNVSRN